MGGLLWSGAWAGLGFGLFVGAGLDVAGARSGEMERVTAPATRASCDRAGHEALSISENGIVLRLTSDAFAAAVSMSSKIPT